MAELTKPRVKINATAKAGEVLEVKTLISHPMENGLRKDATGKTIPIDIIKSLVATYNGKEVFSAKLATGTSANPYIAFFVKADTSGDLVLTYTDSQNQTITDTQKITVS